MPFIRLPSRLQIVAALLAMLIANMAWAHPLAPALLSMEQVPLEQVSTDLLSMEQATPRGAKHKGAAKQEEPASHPGTHPAEARSGQLYQVTWQLPQSPGTERLDPQLPEGCQARNDPVWDHPGIALRARWLVYCDRPLPGQSLTVEGLEYYSGGALLRVTLLDGRRYQQLQNMSSEPFVIPERAMATALFANATGQGIDHLLSGVDHLLFIAVLTLMLGWGRSLFWTATLFTAGHSVTLALASLGWLHIPRQWIDPLIALSVVAACAQMLAERAQREVLPGGQPALARGRPWWPAAGFGLLHGLGFATALDSAGIARADLPLTLAGFNLGIELGQLVIIAAVAISAAVLRRLRLQQRPWLRALPGYTAGAVAAAWFWEQLAVVLR